MAVSEFGSDKGNSMLVVRALCGVKLSRADIRDILSEQLHDLGYRSSIAEPDVWMQPAVKPVGFVYYECVLFYVDDVICIIDDSLRTMKSIQSKFKLKGLSKRNLIYT